MSNRQIAILGIVLSIAVGCTQDTEQSRSKLTQREKDSILAGSQIPGARAVKKTMTTADSAAARQARIDSAQQNP
jgi:hypothetical protein